MSSQEENYLKLFVESANNVNTKNLSELVKVSLSLLKTTPAIREAILDFFSTLFNISVKTHLTNIETEIATGESVESTERTAQEESCIDEVHNALVGYVTSTPEAWAPIISTWSLQLLGQLSTRYAGRAHIPVNAGLSEKMQLWMGCRATRSLMDITTQCLSCLMDFNTEASINALLDSSVKHSPHFDWVVAHVGGCFPDTVITRVLSCGLKDYVQQPRSSASTEKAQKLASIVGILGHLASNHFDDIRAALLNLFKNSLSNSKPLDSDAKMQRKVTVPYLLQLASMSTTLRKALTMDIQQTVNVNVIIKISTLMSEWWWWKYFDSADALMDLLVNLVLGCEQGGLQIINLLMDCILFHDVPEIVNKYCQFFLENILLEMDSLIRTNNDIPLLSSIGNELPALEHLLLDSNCLRSDTACRIIILLGQKNPSALMLSSSFLLRKSKTDKQLFLLIKILSDSLNCQISNEYKTYGGCLGTAIEHAIGFTEINLEEEDELFIYAEEIDLDNYADSNSDIGIGNDKNSSPEKVPNTKIQTHNTNIEQLYNQKAMLFWSNLLKLLKWEKLETERDSTGNSSENASDTSFNIFEHYAASKTQKQILLDDDLNQDISSTLLSSRSVSRAIFDTLLEISLIFGDCTRHPQVCHVIAELLNTLNMPSITSTLNPPSVDLILHLTTVTVKYFFTCCLEEDHSLRSLYSNRICELLNRFSLYANAARTLAIRELLEHALFKPQSVLFGAKYNPEKTYADDMLLYQNLKQGMSTLQRDSSIFHAGIIGTGCQKVVYNNRIEKDIVNNNITWLIRAIEACCMSEPFRTCMKNDENVESDSNATNNKYKSTVISLEAMEKVSLFLVENISSDVMYNGLPWPEEEHMKVTIERDLHIRRLFNDVPLLWDLMNLLAKYPPSLCFCSVLLRGLTATLLHQWNSLGHRSTTESEKEQMQVDTLTEQTTKLLDLMSLGQLLPKPLSNIRDIVPFLQPNEVSQLIRESVWSYMRPNEHVPSPALFKVDSFGRHYRDPESVRPSNHYTDPLRLILQRNIDKLGEHYWLMFDTTNDDNTYNEFFESINNEKSITNTDLNTVKDDSKSVSS